MKDKILLNNMAFYGYHGVYDNERQLGQRFFVDVEIIGDFTTAGRTDNLEDAVDYTIVYCKVKDIMENKSFRLLEAAATCISESILETPGVTTVQVRVRKPAVAIPGILDYVQVEVMRSK